jgi:hypothetical protein
VAIPAPFAKIMTIPIKKWHFYPAFYNHAGESMPVIVIYGI